MVNKCFSETDGVLLEPFAEHEIDPPSNRIGIPSVKHQPTFEQLLEISQCEMGADADTPRKVPAKMAQRKPRRGQGTKRLWICITLVFLFTTVSAIARGDGVQSETVNSLQSKFGTKFDIGVGLGGMLPNDYSQAEQNLIINQFGSVTPENCMKMNAIQPREDEFHFEQADAIVAFAQKNKLKVAGHTLVWVPDQWTPEWVFRDGDKPASKELVLARMRKHIQTVVSRYRGKLVSWDVVNEALGDGDAFLRPSKWTSIAGPEFVANAFKWTHEADPDAVLIYNDVNLEQPKRREKLLRLVRELRAKKIPIHGVGVQGHWEVDYVPFGEIDALFASIKKLGLKVMVTELDLAVVSRGRWWADGGKHRDEIKKTDPLSNGCPAELLERQARVYGELFRLFHKHSSSIDRVTFWNLHDGRSWLNSWPWKHTEYPLLFDRNCMPKPAFLTVMGGNNQKEQSSRSDSSGTVKQNRKKPTSK